MPDKSVWPQNTAAPPNTERSSPEVGGVVRSRRVGAVEKTPHGGSTRHAADRAHPAPLGAMPITQPLDTVGMNAYCSRLRRLSSLRISPSGHAGNRPLLLRAPRRLVALGRDLFERNLWTGRTPQVGRPPSGRRTRQVDHDKCGIHPRLSPRRPAATHNGVLRSDPAFYVPAPLPRVSAKPRLTKLWRRYHGDTGATPRRCAGPLFPHQALRDRGSALCQIKHANARRNAV